LEEIYWVMASDRDNVWERRKGTWRMLLVSRISRATQNVDTKTYDAIVERECREEESRFVGDADKDDVTAA
jgi:bisphosphoglycerate-independent phosphoglycerate mutase (AlkP superfamily)